MSVGGWKRINFINKNLPNFPKSPLFIRCNSNNGKHNSFKTFFRCQESSKSPHRVQEPRVLSRKGAFGETIWYDSRRNRHRKRANIPNKYTIALRKVKRRAIWYLRVRKPDILRNSSFIRIHEEHFRTMPKAQCMGPFRRNENIPRCKSFKSVRKWYFLVL